MDIILPEGTLSPSRESLIVLRSLSFSYDIMNSLASSSGVVFNLLGRTSIDPSRKIENQVSRLDMGRDS